MKKYKEVPYIISTKDLDYLTDMFNWHYGAYKNNLDIINHLSDNSLKKYVKRVNEKLYLFMNDILTILKEGNNENK